MKKRIFKAVLFIVFGFMAGIKFSSNESPILNDDLSNDPIQKVDTTKNKSAMDRNLFKKETKTTESRSGLPKNRNITEEEPLEHSNEGNLPRVSSFELLLLGAVGSGQFDIKSHMTAIKIADFQELLTVTQPASKQLLEEYGGIYEGIITLHRPKRPKWDFLLEIRFENVGRTPPKGTLSVKIYQESKLILKGRTKGRLKIFRMLPNAEGGLFIALPGDYYLHLFQSNRSEDAFANLYERTESGKTRFLGDGHLSRTPSRS